MLEEEAREYHTSCRPGKIAVAITTPCATQHDLALANTEVTLHADTDLDRRRRPRPTRTAPNDLCATAGDIASTDPTDALT